MVDSSLNVDLGLQCPFDDGSNVTRSFNCLSRSMGRYLVIPPFPARSHSVHLPHRHPRAKLEEKAEADSGQTRLILGSQDGLYEFGSIGRREESREENPERIRERKQGGL